MTRAFTVVIERDQESSWLVGEVVELPGCYTQAPLSRVTVTPLPVQVVELPGCYTQAPSIGQLEQLEQNIREAVVAYLKTMDTDESLSEFVGTWRIEVAA